MIGAPPGSPPGPSGPQPVLIEKGDPFVAQDYVAVHPDTTQNPADTRGFNSVLVDMLPGAGALATSLTVLGSASQGGPWVQEVDPQAFQSGIVPTAAHRYLVANVSLWVAIALSNPAGWRVVLTPLNAASTTNVAITGTSTSNIAQYGGVAVGPTNPLDVRPNGAVDVSDRAARALGTAAVTATDGALATVGAVADAAVTTNAAGTVSGKLRGLVALLAGVVNLTFGWLRVLVQPTTFNLVGTSAANTAQTATQAAAGVGVRNYLSGLTVSWSGAAPAAGANVQVKDGATVIWDSYFGQAGGIQGVVDFEFTMPLQGTANTALSITVAAGGASVTTKVSAQGTTGP